MEYTIKSLADLAGVTPRTLRWYDRQGLLKPLRTTEAGYRLYGAGGPAGPAGRSHPDRAKDHRRDKRRNKDVRQGKI